MRGKKSRYGSAFYLFIFKEKENWSLCLSTDFYKVFLLGWEAAPLVSLCSRVLGTVGSWIWTGEPQYTPTLVLWPAGIFCASSNFACGSQWPEAALQSVVVISPNPQPSFLHALGQKNSLLSLAPCSPFNLRKCPFQVQVTLSACLGLIAMKQQAEKLRVH